AEVAHLLRARPGQRERGEGRVDPALAPDQVGLGPLDGVDVRVDRLTALLRGVRAAPGEHEDREHARRAAEHYFRRSTVETLPSRWAKTSLTSPLPAANQQVRVPLPYGKPFWVSVERTTSARNDPAGTCTDCMPTTRVWPSTPNVRKS